MWFMVAVHGGGNSRPRLEFSHGLPALFARAVRRLVSQPGGGSVPLTSLWVSNSTVGWGANPNRFGVRDAGVHCWGSYLTPTYCPGFARRREMRGGDGALLGFVPHPNLSARKPPGTSRCPTRRRILTSRARLAMQQATDQSCQSSQYRGQPADPVAGCARQISPGSPHGAAAAADLP